MLAAQFLGPGRVEAVETDNPTPHAGEALLRIDGCGICGTDLYIYSGKHPRARPPVILGHEFFGHIVAMGPEGDAPTDFRTGDRVTCFPLISCGTCHACRTSNSHVCRSLRLYGIDEAGGMAEYVRLPVSTLVKLPDALSSGAAALIEPLAVGVHAVELVAAPLNATDTGVVIGAGPIGLVTAIALRHRGVENIIVTDLNEFRLEIARNLSFDAYNPLEEDVVELVRAKTEGEGADLVFEAAGTPPAARQMTEVARCRSTIVNVSVFKEPAEVDLQAVNFKELTLVGAHVYTPDDYRTAIEVAQGGEVEKLVTHRLPLQEVSGAFDLFKSGQDVCKIVLEPES